MKSILSILSVVMLSIAAQAKSETFTLEYEVLTGKAVCWQTCRDSRCEEASYSLFWDLKTFKALQGLSENQQMRVQEYDCIDELNVKITDEHMPKLMQENPDLARKILKEHGKKLKLVIYSNLKNDLSDFIDNLLNK